MDVYSGEGRKRVRKSTGTSDKVKARIIEQSVIAANKNITTRQRAIIIIDNVLTTERKGLLLCESIEFYRSCSSDEGLSITKCSMTTRLSILSKLAMWAHDHTRISFVEEVDATIAFEFVKALKQSGKVTANTINHYVGDLSVTWKLFMRHNKAKANPWPLTRVQRNRAEEKTGRAFTSEEISRLLSVARAVGRDWETVMLIGLYTGLRHGDAASLRWNEVDFASGIIRHVPFKTRKHGISVVIPLHPSLSAWLASHRNDSEFVTPNRVGKVGADGFADGDKTFSQLLTEAKIAKTSDHDKLSFHCFRHTFVSMLSRAGVSEDVRMRLAGHTSRMNHAIYTHDDVSARNAIFSLPEISYTV